MPILFRVLDTFGRENYDAWIANLECPVTSTYRSAQKQNSTLYFSCMPDYLPEARKWFDIFSLANNHTDNMERIDGFQQTKNFLDQSEFQYFGHSDNSNSEEVCEVVTVSLFSDHLISSSPDGTTPLTPSSLEEGEYGYKVKKSWFENEEDFEEYRDLLEKSDEEVSEEYEGELDREFNVPIALCGFHGVFDLPTDEDIAVIEEYAKYLPTFVMPHQGVEYKFKANSYQENIYRKMIDLGADAVIGGHTHTVQNTEVYKDKLIVYSLGNFIFDQTTEYKTQGMAVSAKMTFDYDKNFQEWLKISKLCMEQEDDCLVQAAELGLEKPVFTVEYDAVGTDNSSRVVKKASADVEGVILERANWEETVKELVNGDE